jgi:hypothetical protein
MNLNKGFLQHIFGIIPVLQNVQYGMMYAVAEAVHQPPKSKFIPLPQTAYEIRFIHITLL